MSPALPRGGLRSAAVFALCALFAVLAMGLTLLASGAYRDTAAVAEVNYTRRTALSYLVHQVRRSDADGCVYVESFGGGDALALVEPAGGSSYITLLYCYGGQLRELYVEEGYPLLPEDGLPVLELSSLDIRAEGGLLCFTATASDGTVSSVSVAPRCRLGGEVGML
ncbi:DUF4860 domain-containing protein [Intestinimonas sp. UBA1698]|uniref:DUF4860 domain-containing protein n=2 Tax=unclassified Intestinimonas TaxID=2685768 RepID=UPI00257BA0C0|nr:DUF4860 domain-containing protein [Intestinimonas sp. UBA1698]